MQSVDFSTISRISEPISGIADGKKLRCARPKGSAEALSVAQEAVSAKAAGRLLMVICADPTDVLRLSDEIPWFDSNLRCAALPDWETLPYDQLSPHADLVGERLETLYALLNRDQLKKPIDVLLVSATTAAQKLAPRSFISSTTFFFKEGEEIDIENLRTSLTAAGYEHVSQVVAPGEYSCRGGLIDLFPMGAVKPFRLDFFDDEIEQIRVFDPDTQRSEERVKEVRVLPGHEFPMDKASRAAFLSRWREVFPGDPSKVPLYKNLQSGIAAAGIENYLPLFFEATETLFDYTGERTSVILAGPVEEALQHFEKETKERAKFLEADNERPLLPLKDLFQPGPEFFTNLSSYARIQFLNAAEGQQCELPPLAIDRSKTDPLTALKDYRIVCGAEKRRMLIVAPSRGRADTIGELFKDNGFECAQSADFNAFLNSDEPCAITVGPLYSGMLLKAPAIAVITEAELYAASPRQSHRRRRRSESQSNIEMMIRDLSELKIGDPVVHIEHGIGRYRGLTTIDTPEGPAEFLQLEYAKEAKLYVPVAQLHLICRYSGADPETAPLHTLGRGDWEKARKKAALMVRDTAAELLNIYALRESRKGYSFKWSQNDYDAFCEGFPFEETEDQRAAIEAVLDDMKSGKPMDRLVCGDVGFGKTEVALRAAFAAAMSGKTTAVLCPTTLLAEQHAKTFRDRFAHLPVQIAELSRFRSSKETTATLNALKEGKIDIVVGTHKLLSESVEFPNLGLVIIDEEHRFGVRQKEKLKSLRANVDILTLTATPIPRTLSMSLEGIRDFSVITTAPQKRLAIKTFVRRESNSLIREAVLRELKRGGQVYFLHNEVDTIENRRMQLQELLPEARIGVAHGQMNEKELELVMRDFYAQRTNLLLCTTIIETGIDVPNANTILMHRADMFGLAQLHQLRGRVGRSHHQAYAYLLTPSEGAMTKNAEKRLEAIQSMEDLGSGFYLAMHDLEIRGAGEVLGEHQSGTMNEVGFEVYNNMLEAAVESLKRGKEPNIDAPLSVTTEINLHSPALLRSDYVADVQYRLALYKRLAAAKTRRELIDIREEIIDRYGKLTEEAKNLILTHRIRIEAKPIGILKIDAAEEMIIFTFEKKPNLDVNKLFSLMQQRKDLRMMGPDRLKLMQTNSTAEKRGNAILNLLEQLK